MASNKYQEIFDTVATHLIKQGGPAMNVRGTDCAYRAQDGKMCAVGCLMTDEEYTSDFEGNGVVELIDKGWRPQGVDRMTPKMRSFLQELQTAHDNCLDEIGIDAWRARMVYIAGRYNLKMGEAA